MSVGLMFHLLIFSPPGLHVYQYFTASRNDLWRVTESNVKHLGDYKKAYPDAKLIAPEEAITRHGDKELAFDGGMI